MNYFHWDKRPTDRCGEPHPDKKHVCDLEPKHTEDEHMSLNMPVANAKWAKKGKSK